jgi:sugar transferase (PEP-CTERM system associated)
MRALNKSDPSAEIVGYFPSPNDESPVVPETQILSRTKTLTDTAKALKVDEIVVALTERRGGSMPLRELLDCKLHGIRVLDLASHFEQTLGQIRLDSLYAGWLIFGDGFSQGALRAVVKRLSDILFASILILLSLPIMLVTGLLIIAENGFPVFYRQERVGLNGRLFNVIKFRSMRNDAEKDGKPIWAKADDDRTTKVGKIIRKLRIDELPQLFSVLKGDMSLVGPRPERPFFVDQLTKEIPFYAVRHSVKPGVTGWAQVRYHYGATVEDSAEKLQYDLYYVKNHSLFLDLVVLFETIGVVLTGKGAH